MFDFLKPKTKKEEILEVDTGEGKGSYGELLNPPKPQNIVLTGAMPVSYVSGIYTPWLADHYLTGSRFIPPSPKLPEPELGELDLDSCEQCGENAWDGRICHSCGAKNI